MKKKMYVAAWKMNLNRQKTLNFLNEFSTLPTEQKQVFVCPSTPYLSEVLSATDNSRIGIISQDCSVYDNYGAFTGEYSATMLKEIGVSGVIIGHSERRVGLGETSKIVNKKLINILNNDLMPILCIGEDLDIRDNGGSNEFLSKQLTESLTGIKNYKNLVVAYEPIWSISSSKIKRIPTKEEIQDTIKFLKSTLNSFTEKEINVLYGGSVGPENIELYNSIEEIDGYLIGSSSLDKEKFSFIVNS